MPDARYHPLVAIVAVTGDSPDRVMALACGHAVMESHRDKPTGGFLRCRLCPKVAARPALPDFAALLRGAPDAR